MEFRDLEFKTLEICKMGSRFPFVAHITEDEMYDRVKNSRMNYFLKTSEEMADGVRCIFIYECDKHIGTYNCESGTLYTGSRETFCQMA